MSNEPDILVWLNNQSGDQEREQRKILQQKIFMLLVAVARRQSTPDALSIGLAEAIAEYVAYGICGGTYKRERQ